jgi:hypothetical protein
MAAHGSALKETGSALSTSRFLPALRPAFGRLAKAGQLRALFSQTPTHPFLLKHSVPGTPGGVEQIIPARNPRLREKLPNRVQCLLDVVRRKPRPFRDDQTLLNQSPKRSTRKDSPLGPEVALAESYQQSHPLPSGWPDGTTRDLESNPLRGIEF